jgi:hypothetical protein
MDELGDLLNVSDECALRFFFNGLREVSGPDVPLEEIPYPASVLAHYSLTSITTSSYEVPTPANLTDVFENFVLWDLDKGCPSLDQELLEQAGSQILFLVGFFPKQMSRRHNLRWWMALGQDFYKRSSECSIWPTRELTLRRMSKDFVNWTLRFEKLQEEFRDRPYIIRPN